MRERGEALHKIELILAFAVQLMASVPNTSLQRRRRPQHFLRSV
jgi:hypothetical protein